MKNSQQKYSVLVVLGLLLILAGGWIYFHYFFDLLGECNKEVTEQKLSPEENYMAHELLLGCGATSDFATQINIRNQNSGNEQLMLSLKGDHTQSCRIEWASEIRLKIECSDEIPLVYEKVNVFETVEITYVGVND